MRSPNTTDDRIVRKKKKKERESKKDTESLWGKKNVLKSERAYTNVSAN